MKTDEKETTRSQKGSKDKERDWKRYRSLQKEAQASARSAEKQFFKDVISGNLKQDPKCFFSYIKSRKQDYLGVSSLIDKNGYSTGHY